MFWKKNMSKKDIKEYVLTKFEEKGFIKEKKYSRESNNIHQYIKK